MSEATNPEPAPIPEDGAPSAHDLVIEDLREHHGLHFRLVIEDVRERKAMGLAKYNTILQPNNGRDSLVDAYQEALDLAAYLRNEREKRGDLTLVVQYRLALELLLLIRGEMEERHARIARSLHPAVPGYAGDPP